MPDAWMVLDEEGKQEMVDADDPEYDAEGMEQFMYEIPCPSCGQREMRVVIASGELNS